MNEIIGHGQHGPRSTFARVAQRWSGHKDVQSRQNESVCTSPEAFVQFQGRPREEAISDTCLPWILSLATVWNEHLGNDLVMFV